MPTGFDAENVWRARGRGFQMGVAQPDGVVIHLTGQVAWDAEEEIVGRGDVGAQTRRCLANIDAILKRVGGGLSDVVAVTTYYTDRAQLPAIQKARAEAFPPETAPVSTSVMVAGLGHPDFLVELTPIAVIPRDRFVDPNR